MMFLYKIYSQLKKITIFISSFFEFLLQNISTKSKNVYFMYSDISLKSSEALLFYRSIFVYFTKRDFLFYSFHCGAVADNGSLDILDTLLQAGL